MVSEHTQQDRVVDSGARKLRHTLRKWHEYAEAVQQFLINLSLLAVPLLSAAVPAFLTGNAIMMHYPELLHIEVQAAVYLGWIAGIAIELLGIASVDNTFTLWAWNERYGKNDAKRAPFKMAVGIAGFYLVTVLLLVVMLKVWPVLAIWSLIPLSCLGVISAASLALRSQHIDRVLGEGQWGAKTAKTNAKPAQNGGENGGAEVSAKPAKAAKVEGVDERQPTPVLAGAADANGMTRIQQEALISVINAVGTGQVTSDATLGAILGAPESTARRWRKLAESVGAIHKNGDGRFHVGAPDDLVK